LDGAAQGDFHAHAPGSRRLAMGDLGGHRFWPSYRLPGFPATLFGEPRPDEDRSGGTNCSNFHELGLEIFNHRCTNKQVKSMLLFIFYSQCQVQLSIWFCPFRFRAASLARQDDTERLSRF
jgi:hypothetical protein